jgi:CheY-like chemotaxis protein
VNRTRDWLQAEADAESPPARSWRDWALAALVLVTAVAEPLLRSDMAWRPVAPVVGLVLALATLWRRTRPLAMVALGFGTFMAVDLSATFTGNGPFSLFAGASVLVLVYSLFRWGTGREAAIGSVIVIVIAEWGVAITTDSTGAIEAIVGLAVLLSVAPFGVAIRYRRIVRRQQFERVRFHERDMLARELHDHSPNWEAGVTIRVLIADDQDIVRTGLATILGSQPDVDVIGQAADGREAVALARRLRPDVCLFDIRMPHLDGVEATRILAGPDVPSPWRSS